MKTFKDTKYGDLTGETFKGDVSVPINVESLDGAPEIVNGNFNCWFCPKLTDLKGAPEVVEGNFNCSHCKNLETLKGAPRKCKKIDCSGCKKLKNLDPLLKCEIKEVVADKHLLDEYNKKKKIVEKHGYDKAMEVFEMLDDLL